MKRGPVGPQRLDVLAALIAYNAIPPGKYDEHPTLEDLIPKWRREKRPPLRDLDH